MRTDAGEDVYEVAFGTPLSYTPDTPWNSADAAIETILKDLMEMESYIQDSGWGGNNIVLAGKSAFQAAVKVVSNRPNNSPIAATIDKKEVNIAGYAIRLVNSSYKGADGTSVPAIPANKVCMVDTAAPHTRFFLALDDIEAGLVPLPFFVSSEMQRAPSGVKLIGKSKPIPAPVVKAICWATVIS